MEEERNTEDGTSKADNSRHKGEDLSWK